jgi:16S rRNA (cytosine967-C5)-methyltransferase
MARHMKRPLPLRPHIAHALIVIGVAQLRFMDIAPHAAINETVAATGRREQPFRGLINAVLRAVEKDPTPSDRRDNLPAWMRARYEAAYGAAQTANMADAHARSPALDICFKSPDKAAAFAESQKAERLSASHLRLARPGHVPSLPGFEQGDWFVQDIAAGLPALMLDGALDAEADILDLCAAPGGKTMQLAARGHRVTALDMSQTRLARLRENLTRTGLSANIITADALSWQAPEPFDAILLDAPCSASGTLRRHPDLALNRNEGYMAKLAALQTQLLERATHWLRPTGYLCYAVCSLDPQEGEEQAAAFLSRHTNFRLITPKNVPHDLLHQNMLRTTPADWPEKGGMDGFFAALFQKTGE